MPEPPHAFRGRLFFRCLPAHRLLLAQDRKDSGDQGMAVPVDIPELAQGGKGRPQTGPLSAIKASVFEIQAQEGDREAILFGLHSWLKLHPVVRLHGRRRFSMAHRPKSHPLLQPDRASLSDAEEPARRSPSKEVPAKPPFCPALPVVVLLKAQEDRAWKARKEGSHAKGLRRISLPGLSQGEHGSVVKERKG